LVRRNALILRHETFRPDANRLVAAIEQILGAPAAAASVTLSPKRVRSHQSGSPTPDKRAPKGQILYPSSGQQVPRSFTAEGILSDIPADGHIWIAVKIGNLLWPKEPEIPSQDYSWSQHIFEGGDPPGGRFSLTLLLVNPGGNELIEKWIKNGRSSGHWPGLNDIPSTTLNAVQDLMLE
jgi:hypothetical protein